MLLLKARLRGPYKATLCKPRLLFWRYVVQACGGGNKLLVHPEGNIRGSSWLLGHGAISSIRHDGVQRESSSQRHSKHTDHTVHGAILPPDGAASWKTQTSWRNSTLVVLRPKCTVLSYIRDAIFNPFLMDEALAWWNSGITLSWVSNTF